MNLLMEDMRTFKEIPIKACRECRFSNGGQYFAAVNSNVIQVYKTYTCEQVGGQMRGHNNKVQISGLARPLSAMRVECARRVDLINVIQKDSRDANHRVKARARERTR